MSNILHFTNGTNIDIEQVARTVVLEMIDNGEIPTGGEIKPEDLSNAIAAYIEAHPEVLSNSTFGDTFRWVITDGTFETGAIDTTTGQNKTGNSYARTGYCPVTPGEDVFGGYCTIYYYDSNKNYVSYFAFTSSAGHLGVHTTVPNGVAYARVSGTKPSSGKQQFQCYRWKYGIFQSYIYNYASEFSQNHMFSKFKDDYSRVGFSNYLKVNRFGDKRILTLGDSFSAGGEWQKDLEVNLHCRPIYNYSKSGGRITNTYATETDDRWVMRQYEKFKTDNPNIAPDVIIICLGTNDVGNGADGIGSFDSTTWVSDPSRYDVKKFYGGLQYLLWNIMTDFPNAQIYCGMTPMQGLTNPSSPSYVDAMKDVCEKYCIRYIDTSKCQVNPYVASLDVYRNSRGDGHPSAMGKHRIGRYMAEILLSQGGWFPERNFEYGLNIVLPID